MAFTASVAFMRCLGWLCLWHLQALGLDPCGIGVGCLGHLQPLFYLWGVLVRLLGVHSICRISEMSRLVFYLFIYLLFLWRGV